MNRNDFVKKWIANSQMEHDLDELIKECSSGIPALDRSQSPDSFIPEPTEPPKGFHIKTIDVVNNTLIVLTILSLGAAIYFFNVDHDLKAIYCMLSALMINEIRKI